ncbi:MAG: DUF2330 domain-containing protein [Armatimonadota bacterium]
MRPLRLAPVLLLLACVPILGDGGFFPPVHGVATTADQRAVVIDHSGAETIVLQTAYDGDASDFAWVIPVPALISAAQSVGTTDPGLFDALEQLTAPRHVGAFTSSAGLCGCSGSGGPERRLDGVTVWETLRVEDYEVAVLSAEESADLAQWLDDNGYHLPSGSEDTLQYYVARESFFVALKIAPAAQQAGETGRDGPPGGDLEAGEQLRPITLTFPTEELVFPMRISRVSTRERVEVLLYVLGPHRAVSQNYPTTEVDVPQTWRGDDFTAAYDRWFEEAIADAGGAALVVEYAGQLPSWRAETPPLSDLLRPGREYFLTRLRTRLSPEQMTADIAMAPADADTRFEVVVDNGSARSRGGIAFALLIGGVSGMTLRWRRLRALAWSSALLGVLLLLL